MAEAMAEAVVVSCVAGGGGRGIKIAAWDPDKGAVLRSYSCEAEGGGAALAVLGSTHLLCALKTLPFIYVWHVRKEQVLMKMACPGLVRCLTTTPNAVHCAAAIAEKIHIWEMSTGHLLAVESRHYQPVSALLFTDDGQWLVSGGEDGRVLVWSLRRMLSEAFDSSGVSLPHCEDISMETRPHPPVLHQTWSDHSLPVTSLCCGAGGLRARLATASLDQTCKLYNMASGRLLCSLLFGFSLTAVAMDTAEEWLFVGGATGRIARVSLSLQHLAPAHTSSAEPDNDGGFRGHMQAVTSLAVSGCGLISGSQDSSCRVWDIDSGQTVRLLQMKGPVVCSHLAWGLALPAAGRKKATDPATVSVAPFQKQLCYSLDLRAGRLALHPSGHPVGQIPVCMLTDNDPLFSLTHLTQLCDLSSLECKALTVSTPVMEETEEEMSVHRLREDVTRLRAVNRTLYSLLKENSNQSHSHFTD